MPFVSALRAGCVESIVSLSGGTIGGDFNDCPVWVFGSFRSGGLRDCAAPAPMTANRAVHNGIRIRVAKKRVAKKKGRKHQSVPTPPKKARADNRMWLRNEKSNRPTPTERPGTTPAGMKGKRFVVQRIISDRPSDRTVKTGGITDILINDWLIIAIRQLSKRDDSKKRSSETKYWWPATAATNRSVVGFGLKVSCSRP